MPQIRSSSSPEVSGARQTRCTRRRPRSASLDRPFAVDQSRWRHDQPLGTRRRRPRRVAHLPAELGELVADLVGALEVLSPPGPPRARRAAPRPRRPAPSSLGLGERLEPERASSISTQRRRGAPATSPRFASPTSSKTSAIARGRVEVVGQRVAEAPRDGRGPAEPASLAGSPAPAGCSGRSSGAARPGPRPAPSARVAERQRLAVVAGDQVSDDRLAPVPVERLRELEDVALRLRHLLGVGLDHPVVHPDPGEAAARAASDWAISFSWWGKTRSEPPPWIAKDGRRAPASAIAEHSMCQPGRPGPQGESQQVSSPSLCDFQRAKSSGLSLSELGAGLLALVHVLRAAVGELAVAVEAARPGSRRRRRTRRRGRRRSASAISSTIPSIVSVASGSASGRPRPSRLGVLEVGARSSRAANSPEGSPALAAAV